jgi:ATP citrate (pro-S)-lyase
MRKISDIQKNPGTILAIGSYGPAYQSILDFDALTGKQKPSIVGIVGSNKRFEKYFWHRGEVLIPCFKTIEEAKQAIPDVNWLLNIASARRAYQTSVDFFKNYPDAVGAHIFAEDVPEIHALKLFEEYVKKGKTIIGPAGVGLIVPGSLKLGVVGGVDWRQLKANHLDQAGSVAVMSASGGMINELITMVAASGHNISFALCFGGDRFPATTPRDAFLAAEAHQQTKQIVYYGELGGSDEYEIVSLIESKKLTKPVIAYIAGAIGENFDTPVQFGHAKALAGSRDETASAKRKALRVAGVTVAKSVGELSKLVSALPKDTINETPDDYSGRQSSLFTSTISLETEHGYQFVGKTLEEWSAEGDIAAQITSALLGRQPKSPVTVNLVREIFLLSVDHGPQVSGALNTIVTARAGKGIVDSLAAGLMTVGPRFGGAVSDAAREWFDAVQNDVSAADLVEKRARAKEYISGIGHKKYRLDLPDPRTAVLAKMTKNLKQHVYFDFAKSVEAITTQKKGNLILNVDGHIAALMLDVLAEKEGFGTAELEQMISADFFNALFVLPRLIGFTAHYLDQKRIDEGLFRLPDNDVFLWDNEV